MLRQVNNMWNDRLTTCETTGKQHDCEMTGEQTCKITGEQHVE